MANLKDFFRDLLNWEKQHIYEPLDETLQELSSKTGVIYEDTDLKSGQPSVELIHQWPQELRDTIVSAFKNAVSDASLKGSVCPLTPGSSNQSIGNQVEKYIVQKLGEVISGFSISKCRGGGYPDQVLTQKSTGLRIPLEMKATANWNDADANRVMMQLAFDFNRPDDYTIYLPTHIDEFWTAKQRAGHSLHEVSYRACYKPQLPAYFIKKFCKSESVIYDPFMGRGTTLIEAQLHGHRVIGNDVNPLSKILIYPRLNPPTLTEIEKRLQKIKLSTDTEIDEELLVFFHEDTLQEIYGWRTYFQQTQCDIVDMWLQMVACTRLTGHSSGFFSVFTLPPNLAASITSQRRINEKRNQKPEYRDTKALIHRKSKQLLRHSLPDHFSRDEAILLTESADRTPQIEDESVDLVVTSPPFLDTIDYMQDNWLRMWFCGIEIEQGKIWQLKSIEEWTARMANVFVELYRVLKHGGRVAFEVGEVRNGTVFLEDAVVKAALDAGLTPEKLMINMQHFTKTANCWGVANNRKGTNSNRIVILKRD